MGPSCGMCSFMGGSVWVHLQTQKHTQTKILIIKTENPVGPVSFRVPLEKLWLQK